MPPPHTAGKTPAEGLLALRDRDQLGGCGGACPRFVPGSQVPAGSGDLERPCSRSTAVSFTTVGPRLFLPGRFLSVSRGPPGVAPSSHARGRGHPYSCRLPQHPCPLVLGDALAPGVGLEQAWTRWSSLSRRQRRHPANRMLGEPPSGTRTKEEIR